MQRSKPLGIQTTIVRNYGSDSARTTRLKRVKQKGVALQFLSFFILFLHYIFDTQGEKTFQLVFSGFEADALISHRFCALSNAAESRTLLAAEPKPKDAACSQ